MIVGPREALSTRSLELRGFHLIGDGDGPETGNGGLPVHARVRSTQPLKPALLYTGRDGLASVTLLATENGVAAGQACVLYEDDSSEARILGGGTIARAAGETHHPLMPPRPDGHAIATSPDNRAR